MTEGLPVNSSTMYLIVRELPEGLDTKISKTENECKICGIPFSKKGASQTQRHVCRFCYHAVCSSCSPLTALHPGTNNSERICLACFTHYLKVNIDYENKPRYRDTVRMEVEGFKRRSLEGYENQIDRERRELKDQERNLHDEISRLSLELQQRETLIMTMDLQENHDDAEDESSKIEENQSVAKYINEMKQVEAENNRLKVELTQLKNRPQPVQATNQGGCLKSCSIF